MTDEVLPQSVNNEVLPPPQLSPKQEELCSRLDKFYAKFSLKTKPSNMFRGAVFSTKLENRNNPDWIAQTANSLRDIIYPFGKVGVPNKENALKQYGSARTGLGLTDRLGELYGLMTRLAHHGNARGGDVGSAITAEEFQEKFNEFEDVLFVVLARQTNIHQEIDSVLKLVSSENTDVKLVGELIETNQDARVYFFSKADQRWLSWLWSNGFLDVIKEAAKNPESPVYRIPELSYLVRIAEEAKDSGIHKTITDIVLSIEAYNSGVIEQFFWICSKLPAIELKRVLPKIYEGNWILSLKNYSHYGFEFKKMFETLAVASDDESSLILSEALLSVRPKQERKEEDVPWDDNPFYFKDLENSGVFDFLEGVGGRHLEQALSTVSEAMGKVVLFYEDKRDPGEPFKIGDGFAFYDVDFFGLETGKKKHTSYRDDIRNTAATLKTLISRGIGENCGDEGKVREFFEKYVVTLPDSQAMWRFRLFVLSLCPTVFTKEVKNALFRIAEVDRPHNLTIGSEYKRLLSQSLGLFSSDEKVKYKDVVFQGFSEKDNEKLPKGDVFGICSIIIVWLTEDEKKKAEEYVGCPLNASYKPEPVISPVKTGWVQSRSKISQEELAALTVPDIAKNLRSDWAPGKLGKEREEKGGGTISYDAEGLGNAIKEDMPKRLQEYIQNATLFFDREQLSAHYTYDFFGGVFDIVQKKKADLNIDWDGLFLLFFALKRSFQEKPPEDGKGGREESLTWLAGWDAVHSAAADLLRGLIVLQEDKSSAVNFPKYRVQLLDMIQYLLTYPNPSVESEACSPREGKIGSSDEVKYDCSDPYTHAINSVRGKAFEVFVNFTYRDSEKFRKDALVKISPEVKEIYKNLLGCENTRAILFLFGHYLPSIYFRDKEWVRGLFVQMFDFDDELRRDFSLAAWEGYLTNNIYAELFQELAEFYSKAIGIKRDTYTKREYFKDLDEALATHIALAFMHFSDFTSESPLFQKFWKEGNLKRQEEFVSFIGRYAISRDQAKKWLGENKIDSKKLESLWDWMLGAQINPKVFEAFGFWMDAEWAVFELVWQSAHVRKTLEKTNGGVEWDHNLQQSLLAFVKASPKDALKIVELHFLFLAEKAENQGWIHIDDEILSVFKALYENPDTKQGTYDLIDRLLPYGNGVFWKLEEVIE